VSAGPIPGSTPTAVPTVTPRAAQSRLTGVSATAKPWPSATSVSMISTVSPRGGPGSTPAPPLHLLRGLLGR
jgi:hypothetical protein